MPLGCLPLLRTREPPASTMDTPVTSQKRPASSPLNVKAFEPTCSVRSIFPPRARRCLALGPHPPPTMRSCFIGTGIKEGGGVIAREIVASRVQAPPAFCTEAKVAKRGAYLRDTTVLCISRFGPSSVHILQLYPLFNICFVWPSGEGLDRFWLFYQGL